MLEKGIISTRQFILMLFIIITSFTALQVPGLLILTAGRDAWLSTIGGWLLDVLLAIVYAYLGVRFPGENFVQYSLTILGKYIGGFFGMLFPLFFLMVCSLLQRGLSQLINFAFLPTTPFAVILISGALIIGYSARKGIEVIGRVSEVLGPIYFFSILVLVGLIIPSADIQRLQPQLDQGFYPFLIGSPFILTFYGICIIMGMFIPLNNRIENGFLSKFIAVSMGAFVVGATVTLAVGVFGDNIAKNMISPSLNLTRMIFVGGFIERMEIVWMMIAVGAGIMASSMMIWSFSLGISQIFSLQSYKPFVIPGVFLSSTLALTSFGSNAENTQFIHFSYPLIAFAIETGLILFLLLMALLLKKRGKAS
ncbi:endospore germination permease [Paenibacillus ehimensis]|uniref:GerAB/ArcD/ProY family transporter n=1 Tax=Paenibacillus ehimensis TaxID=79264 RepID=UPI002DB82BBB|nr:endospore germination permease [Paenibacillus ehimensis]MEC0209011.1 endospore germination permease [Paenibacillus ehimensis]